MNNTFLNATQMGNTGTRTTTMVTDNTLASNTDTTMIRSVTTLYAEITAAGVNGDDLARNAA